MYQVELAGDNILNLTNTIVESMYTQVATYGNEYFLFVLLVNYNKDDKAIFSQTSKPLYVADKYPTSLLQVGKFAASGRMVTPHGRSCPI